MNPIAFKLFGLEIRWYGIFIAVGAFLAIVLADRLALKRSDKNLYKGVGSDYGIIALILGVIGARAYYVIFRWDYYSAHPSEILAIRNGGLAIYGGILTGILVGIVFCKIKKINFWDLADIMAPGLALAQGIGRWGNYFNGEAHGRPTNVPWAINVDGVNVHPTFFYEFAVDVSIFFLLYFIVSKRQKFTGQLFSLYMILYGIGRFVIEGMRTDSLYLGAFRVSQLVSIAMAAIGLIFYIRNFNCQKK